MEMPDGNFYDIKIEECPAVVYFDSYGNGHIGTWARENDAKWCLGYVRGDIVEAMKAENDELKALNKGLQTDLDDGREYIEQLKAKLDNTKWQPIETAPKDGTMILVCLPRIMNLVIRAKYNTIHNHWMDENYIDTDGEDNRGVSRFAYYHDGDLWCHIPDAPEQR